ncbi:MAG TPA: winged helix-turn-helix domain-containing protein [Methanofastidiosum sp.]|nr:winged helix-turn-helix domain-containing protein [Methanofastidiosum sp.]HNU61177.1 winged helix-turn-helix domain-containing protein [Methanofastidiosum sp.]HOI77894.1 winged helix-turn-helix domain-containing protein [Methanofastidiosum sp.]
MDDLKELFFNRKTVEILLSMLEDEKPRYPTVIAEEVGSIYPHVFNILKELEEVGLVESYKEGRIRFIRLTAEGRKITEKFREIYSELEGFEQKFSEERTREDTIAINRFRETIKSIEYKLLSENLDKKDSFREVLKLSKLRTELERTNFRNDNDREEKNKLLKRIYYIEEKAKVLLIKF